MHCCYFIVLSQSEKQAKGLNLHDNRLTSGKHKYSRSQIFKRQEISSARVEGQDSQQDECQCG